MQITLKGATRRIRRTMQGKNLKLAGISGNFILRGTHFRNRRNSMKIPVADMIATKPKAFVEVTNVAAPQLVALATGVCPMVRTREPINNSAPKATRPKVYAAAAG